MTESGRDEILLRAQFDPRLKTYYMLSALFLMLATIILIPLIPIWFFLGPIIHKKQYDALESELTARTLNIRKGVLVKTQKNVPLDKITDLAVSEGPVLRALGLCSLRVETAGGGGGSQMGQAFLPGVVDALKFRDAVMKQRDLVTSGQSQAAPAPVARDDEAETLHDIRDSLKRIEGLLEKGLSERA